jgi:hypothetical protein
MKVTLFLGKFIFIWPMNATFKLFTYEQTRLPGLHFFIVGGRISFPLDLRFSQQ